MSRPCAAPLSAAYGGGSFRRHLKAALDAGLAVDVRIDPQLSIDVDTVDDCRLPLVAPLLVDVLGRP